MDKEKQLSDLKSGQVFREDNGDEWVIFKDSNGWSMRNERSGLVLFVTTSELERLKLVGEKINDRKK